MTRHTIPISSQRFDKKCHELKCCRANVERLKEKFGATMQREERLREALGYALWQHDGNCDPHHNHWSAKAREALEEQRYE